MDDKKKKIIAIVVAAVVAITAIVVAVVVVNKKDNDKSPDGVVVDQIGENGEVEVDENGVIISQNEDGNAVNGNNNGASGSNNGTNTANGGNTANNGANTANGGNNASNGGYAANNNGGNSSNNGVNGSNGNGDAASNTPQNNDVTPTKRNIALTVQLPGITQETQLIVFANGVEVENRKIKRDTEVSQAQNREEAFELVGYTGAVEIQVKLVNNAKTLDESVTTNTSSAVINLRDNDIEILPEVIE